METRKQWLLDGQNKAVLRIQILMFLGLLDSDPFARRTDPDPDPSIIKRKKLVRKTLIPTVL
jgi:hypothetical protein